MDPLNLIEEQTEDEFGSLKVFSDKRWEHLKFLATEQFNAIMDAVKKSENLVNNAMQVVLEADNNIKAFRDASKAYAETLEIIENESYKPKF